MKRSTHSGLFVAGLITFIAILSMVSSVIAQDCTAPVGQGYWHRQCLDVDGIERGRNSPGYKEATKAGFEDLILCASGRLMSSFPLDFPAYPDTCNGLDADPPSDRCEQARKQLTALILNVCSGRLADGCAVDVMAEGCSAATVGDLIVELADLIDSDDQPGLCSQAVSCAAAVNESWGLVADSQ